MPETFRLLPVGAEYEHEFAPSIRCTDTRAHIYLYRVVAHSRVRLPNGETGLTERIEAIGERYRRTKILALTWETDAWGNNIWRRELDGNPPSPTYRAALDQHGIDVPFTE